ncbi:hypothetical protein, partial [Gynuella sp.]|uniref:hypothetical protein n=1 Tax=Gynuella sp. TaxID=2969146 RepID=UPI003D129148
MRSIVQKFIPIFFSFFFFSISANASEIWWWDAEYSFVCSDIVEKHPNGKGYVSGYASSYEEG